MQMFNQKQAEINASVSNINDAQKEEYMKQMREERQSLEDAHSKEIANLKEEIKLKDKTIAEISQKLADSENEHASKQISISSLEVENEKMKKKVDEQTK